MIFNITGHIKPYVRTTKRQKFVDPQYKQYADSKDAIGWQFRNQGCVRECDFVQVYFENTFKVKITFHLNKMFISDLDNLEKAIMDAGNGIVWKDDRYCIESHTFKVPTLTEDFTELEVLE